MAEASAHDAMDSLKTVAPSAKVRAYSVKPYAELDKWEKWELTHDTIEQLMQDVWRQPDPEIDNLDQFQYYMNQFILRQKDARKVCNFHYPVAPERQVGFHLKIRPGALRVAVKNCSVVPERQGGDKLRLGALGRTSQKFTTDVAPERQGGIYKKFGLMLLENFI